MAIKSCLTGGDKAQINNALKKNKPVSAEQQKLVEKQEKMFTSLDKDFNKSIAGMKRMDKITAIQKKFSGNGVNITRQKINKMMKGEFTVSKPGVAISPKTIPITKAPPIEVPPVTKMPIVKAPPKGLVETEAPPLIPKSDSVQFLDSKNQALYNKHYNEFMQDAKLATKVNFQSKWKSTMPGSMHKAVKDWKIDTARKSAVGLKMKAEKLEVGGLKTVVRKGLSKKRMLEFADAERTISDNAYVKMRALSQAYFDKMGIKNITLYRGTDGKTGKKIASQLKSMVAKGEKGMITITDNALTGYTSHSRIADRFGPYQGGVTVKVKFRANEVLLPYDLWPQTSHITEYESMCIGGRRSINLKDISYVKEHWL